MKIWQYTKVNVGNSAKIFSKWWQVCVRRGVSYCKNVNNEIPLLQKIRWISPNISETPRNTTLHNISKHMFMLLCVSTHFLIAKRICSFGLNLHIIIFGFFFDIFSLLHSSVLAYDYDFKGEEYVLPRSVIVLFFFCRFVLIAKIFFHNKNYFL